MGLLDGSIKWSLDSLYVESETRVLRFRPWPEPGAWAGMSTTHCQTPLDARIGLADFDTERKRRFGYEARSVECFFARLPPHVRNAVAPFSVGLFELLRLIYEAEVPALELLSSNPALGFAVAMSAQLKTTVGASHWKTPAELVRMKRPEIADWLEFPGGRSAVRLLGRVSMTALNVAHLRTLRSLLSEGEPTVRKRLHHLEQISPDVLALLARPELVESVSPKLIDQASAMPTFGAFLTSRIQRYRENFHRLHPNDHPPKIESVQQLQLLEVYQRLELQEEFSVEVRARLKFPEPPVPGNDNIIPLDNAMELVREGEQQANCAASYFWWVREGYYYLYRMRLPERCTISLARTGAGWVLVEIKIAGNRPPRKEATTRVARRWLRDGAGGKRLHTTELR